MQIAECRIFIVILRVGYAECRGEYQLLFLFKRTGLARNMWDGAAVPPSV